MMENEILDIKWKIKDVIVVYVLYFCVIIVVATSILFPLLREFIVSQKNIVSQDWYEFVVDYWYLFGAIVIVEQLAFMLLPIFWLRARRYGTMSSLGWKVHAWVKHFLIGFAFGFLFRLIPAVILIVTGQSVMIESTRAIFFLNWLVLIAIVIIGPIAESIFFTGFTFPAFAKRFGVRIGAVITALIFGMIHLISFQHIRLGGMFGFFLMEIVVIWLYWRRKSIFSPIGFFMASNLVFALSLALSIGKISENSPANTIQQLFQYSQNERWNLVKDLMTSDYLSEHDQEKLQKLFTSNEVTSVEPIILEKNNLQAQVLLSIITPTVKKVSINPVQLVFQDRSWKIEYLDSLSFSLCPENYTPSDDAGMYYMLGQNYWNLGHLNQAIGAYKKSISLRPDVALPYWGLGIVYCQLMQFEEAISAFKEALAIDSNSPAVHYNLGKLYTYLEEYDKAIESYEQAINLKPDFAEAYGGLALVLSDLGRYDDALRNINQAISLRPDYASTYCNRGYIYYDFQQYNEAIKDFKSAIELDRGYKDSYVGLAITYYQMGNTKAAKENYKKAIQLDKRYRDNIHELSAEGLYYDESQLSIMNEIMSEMGY